VIPKIVLLGIVIFVAVLLIDEAVHNNESDNDIDDWQYDDIDKNKHRK
jgi:hypothetical protein